jgi:hypothetical protein
MEQGYVGGQSSNPFCTQIYCIVNSYEANINPEIRTTQCYARVEYIPSSTTVYLRKPSTYTIAHSRDTVELNFWNKDRTVYGLQRANKTLTMTGCKWNTPSSEASDHLEAISEMVDKGDYITLDNFNDTNLNTTWTVKDFKYERSQDNQYVYNWNMSCEKY